MSDEHVTPAEAEQVKAEAETKIQTAQKATKRANWAGWVVIILSVVFVAQGVISGVRQQLEADCNYRINNEFRAQIIRSREANNAQRQAMIDMIEAITRPGVTDTEKNTAVQHWLEVAKKQQAEAEQVAANDRELERC